MTGRVPEQPLARWAAAGSVDGAAAGAAGRAAGRHARRQAGLTLVELLVATALGLAVLLGASALLVGSVHAHAALVEATEMDDTGRYAMDALARAVRLAALVAPPSGVTPDPAAPPRIQGLDARSLARTTPGIDAPLDDAVNGSDVLALRFTGSGGAPNGDGATLDCAGFAAHRDEEGWSIFYVARNAQGQAELRCKYRGNANWSSDAVAGRVDSFQVLYGLDLDEDGVPERYVNASAVRALDDALVLAGATPAERAAELRRRTHWKRVALVRVALLLYGPRLRLPARSGMRRADPVHDLFGPEYGAAFGARDQGTRLGSAALDSALRGEGPRMRKVYGVTVALPIALPPTAPAAAPSQPGTSPDTPPGTPPDTAPGAPPGTRPETPPETAPESAPGHPAEPAPGSPSARPPALPPLPQSSARPPARSAAPRTLAGMPGAFS